MKLTLSKIVPLLCNRTYSTESVLPCVILKSCETREPHCGLLFGVLYRTFFHLASLLRTFMLAVLSAVLFARIFSQSPHPLKYLFCENKHESIRANVHQIGFCVIQVFKETTL
jgi:hypothetical protein